MELGTWLGSGQHHHRPHGFRPPPLLLVKMDQLRVMTTSSMSCAASSGSATSASRSWPLTTGCHQ